MENVIKTLRKMEIELRAKARAEFLKCNDKKGQIYNAKANVVNQCIEKVREEMKGKCKDCEFEETCLSNYKHYICEDHCKHFGNEDMCENCGSKNDCLYEWKGCHGYGLEK